MTRYLIFLLVCSYSNSFASAGFKADFSGSLDLQSKQVDNPDSAKNNGQTWASDNENFTAANANIDAIIHLGNHIIDAHWFVRYSKSALHNENFYAPAIINYPYDLMGREIWKLAKVEYGEDNTLTESILTRFAYAWKDEDTVFKLGRIWVQYGDGLIFNPINPFNIPLTLSSNRDIVQGNDGMEFQFLSDSKLKLYLYILGDREILDYDEGQLSRTILLRGDYDYSEKLNILYILGEDQKRHKYGFELKYSLASGFLLSQLVNNTKRIDLNEDSSESLTQYILAYERDLTETWSIRFEGGKNDLDELGGGSLYEKTFLPQENYIALLNSFKISDRWAANANLSSDTETRFAYLGLNLAFQVQQYLELRAFTSSVIAKSEEESIESGQMAQLYVPNEFGIGLRAVF